MQVVQAYVDDCSHYDLTPTVKSYVEHAENLVEMYLKKKKKQEGPAISKDLENRERESRDRGDKQRNDMQTPSPGRTIIKVEFSRSNAETNSSEIVRRSNSLRKYIADI